MDPESWPAALPSGSTYANIQHPVLARSQSHKEPVRAILGPYRRGELVVPDYQRGRVWTPRQQAEFTGFLLEGGPVPAIFIRDVDTDDGFRDELVDGQQRILALIAWEDEKIPAILPSQNRCIWKRDMEWPGWRMNICLPVGRFRGTRAEAMSLYLAINTKGTPHTQAELDRVRGMLEKER